MTEPWWRDESPGRPIKVTGGIQINSARGSVARTWWSKRFLSVLEQIGVGGRMARGRAYARQGQIISLDVDAGGALAKVQGSRPRPYSVRVGVPTFGKAEWGAVAEALVADASYTAALLAGEMPHEIEDVFAAVGLSLFPASARDLALDCTCPDQAVPCKHLAAVCYLLAERFDADPFEILALRGRDRETLLADLRSRRATAASTRTHGAPLAEVLATFYAPAGPLPARVVGPDTPPDALLDQIPPFPVALRGEPVTELLRPVYRCLAF
ncbi:MAG TPA: SWIM zinc finger family protein [Pseudonocardia sp.]